MALLLFGTLLDDELRAIVAGTSLPGRRVHAAGQAVWKSAAGDWPVLTGGSGTQALLVEPGAEAQARLDFYEAAFGYRRARVAVEIDAALCEVDVYRPDTPETASSTPWSLSAWQEMWGPLTRQAANETMALRGRMGPAELARAMPTIRIRAAAGLRAFSDPAPIDLRAGNTRDTVKVLEDDRPYTAFFAVRETRLTHPTFHGERTEPLTRAGFAMGDAVTILPYDPARDRVLVVEQFRYGPWLRGDRYPWSLEPIAGRIDPGESPETAAHRETSEESGLSLHRLVPLARYYPSPGAVSEYLFSFIGLADLPDDAAGLGGLEDEGEDIRSHVLSFSRLEALIDKGEVDNAPLLLSALWLKPRRDGLA